MANKKILGIDTSTENCTVTLYGNRTVLETRKETGKNRHNRVVATFIKEIISEAGMKIADLDGIAVNIGPGSFTGLRIGLSIAKGLAFATEIPLLPVKSIAILREKIRQKGKKLIFIRSHKDNIYYSSVSGSKEQNLNSEINYGTVEEVLQSHRDIDSYWGNYSFESMEKQGELNITYPDAQTLVHIADREFEKLSEKSKSDLEPYYLTNFEAKKWKPGIKKRG